MPQPLNTGSAVQFGPDMVLKYPDLAAEIGNVCANWNLVEHMLTSLYALLMGDYLPKSPEDFPPTHPVAYQVFDSLNAFNPRVDLLDKLLASRASDIEIKHFREVIRPGLRKRFAERSLVAHGIWGSCDDHPDALILVPLLGEQMIWKKTDFQNVSCRILKDLKLLSALASALYAQRDNRT